MWRSQCVDVSTCLPFTQLSCCVCTASSRTSDPRNRSWPPSWWDQTKTWQRHRYGTAPHLAAALHHQAPDRLEKPHCLQQYFSCHQAEQAPCRRGHIPCSLTLSQLLPPANSVQPADCAPRLFSLTKTKTSTIHFQTIITKLKRADLLWKLTETEMN